MLSDIYGWDIEKLVKHLLGVEKKYEAVRFLGISIGGVLLVSQALISYKRAKAMDDTAKAQAKATEEQAKANENTEKGQRQERLKNAIGHLGHEKVSVRLGGANELFHLARDTENLRQTVMDILCAHIRSITSESKYREIYKSEPSEEIQSLLNLLFVQEEDAQTFGGLHIDLRGSWLNGAKLYDARLQNAFLPQARLQGAELDRANLDGAYLRSSKLQFGNLTDAKLRAAELLHAELHCAILACAKLQGARIDEAHFQETNLINTDLRGVSSMPARRLEFEDRIRKRINEKAEIDSVRFSGGLRQTDLDSLVEGLSDDSAKELRTRLAQHIDNPLSHKLPDNNGANTKSYTSEEAEQWIEEYNNAMSEVLENDS